MTTARVDRDEWARSDDRLAVPVAPPIDAARDPDAAVAVLVELHGDHVYRYCRRLLGDDAEADDVAQVVFLEALEALRAAVAVTDARAWLVGIARHRCLDRFAARRRAAVPTEGGELERVVDAGPAAGSDAALRLDADPAARAALDACLDALDARSRAVVLLRFADELSYDEIATSVGDAVGALRVRVNRALPRLRACLERKGVIP
jgi:RNA polymerase sigma-70 factor, ECF subfamily